MPDAHDITTEAHCKPIRVYIDIETIKPSGYMLGYARQKFEKKVTAPKNYKDVEKILAYKAKALEEKLNKLALSSVFAQILCIVVHTSEGDTKCFSRWEGEDVESTDEGLVGRFVDWWKALNDAGYVITWAGKGVKRFDFPIIRTRCLAWDDPMTAELLRFNRYETQKVMDLEDNHYFPNEGRIGSGPSLEDMCAVFGIEGPTGSGSQVEGQFNMGDFSAIELHCISDVLCVRDVFSALRLA